MNDDNHQLFFLIISYGLICKSKYLILQLNIYSIYMNMKEGVTAYVLLCMKAKEYSDHFAGVAMSYRLLCSFAMFAADKKKNNRV